MSASINGDSISLTRGDSLLLNISVNVNDEEYIPEDGDRIRFALKKKIEDSEPLILKEVDMTTMSVMIEPSDTKSFDFGTYLYDVELTTKDGYVYTFIGPARFSITKEVY